MTDLSTDTTAPPVGIVDRPVVEAAVGTSADERPDRTTRRVVDSVVVVGAALFVFWQLHPNLFLADTTPAGGDMGAHVWALGYLRDELLPNFRLSGWTPDWYAGFPAFQFYMVVPFLAMVVLNSGVGGAFALVPALGAAAMAARAGGASLRDRTVVGGLVGLGGLGLVLGVWHGWNPSYRFALMTAGALAGVLALLFGRGSYRRSLGSLAVVVAVAGVALPYGTSFKVVAVAGVVAMPIAAYAFGRLADLAYPTPALLAVAALWFLFDTNFTIYGGNIASTMAGEFAFSISLAFAIAYLGVLVRGLRTGRHRGAAAVLLALVGLCHLIPAFFALAATLVLFVLHVLDEAPTSGPGGRRFLTAFVGLVLAVLGVAFAVLVTGAVTTGPVVAVTTASIAVLALIAWSRVGPAGEPDAAAGSVPGDPLPFGRARAWWLTTMGAIAALLAAFWVLPFFSQRTYLNDMGWEKTAVHREGQAIWAWFTDQVWSVLVTHDLRVPAALALVGAVLSVVFRNRVGVALVILGIGLALAFVFVPQGRLWNARLLPFWYLVVYLLAAIGIGEVTRALAQVVAPDPRRPGTLVPRLSVLAVFTLTSVFLAGQLRNMPGGATNADGSYRLVKSIGVPGVFSIDVPEFAAIDLRGRNFVTDWSRWNFSGYERKPLYPEYRGIVATMAELGESRGCGRSLWEYSPDLNQYGTPMALMLLPHWTDGCIGSMEGLYFEASSTTPFHFLMQSELSASPSRAQRDMPYRDLDLDAGVEHLQLLGVRYYLARSAEANIAARENPDLTEVAASGPWVVYEVADAPLIAPLAFEPAVTTGGQRQDEWLCSGRNDAGRCTGTALDWFQDPTRWDVVVTASGPPSWQRVAPDQTPAERPLEAVTVSDVVMEHDSISFHVDRIGVPVYVKESYFPNWHASGADGPYRAAPNLMVVVPTANDVTLHYGRSPVDIVAALATLLGLAALVVVVRRPPIRVRRLADGD